MTPAPDRIRRVSVERTIAAPAASVFAALTDPSAHAVIDGSDALLLGNAATPTPRLQAGSVFITPMSRRLRRLTRVDVIQVAVAMLVWGRMRNTVVEFDENRRIAWRNFGRHVWRYELQATDDGDGPRTLVRETFDYATNLMPWLLEWAGFPAHNRRAMNQTLAALDGLVTATSK
jgi:Polyketide cyclase / dehydrase and lipid transport